MADPECFQPPGPYTGAHLQAAPDSAVGNGKTMNRQMADAVPVRLPICRGLSVFILRLGKAPAALRSGHPVRCRMHVRHLPAETPEIEGFAEGVCHLHQNAAARVRRPGPRTDGPDAHGLPRLQSSRRSAAAASGIRNALHGPEVPRRCLPMQTSSISHTDLIVS